MTDQLLRNKPAPRPGGYIDIAVALGAALRWMYHPEMIDHIKGKRIGKEFAPEYVADIRAMQRGVEAARELDIDVWSGTWDHSATEIASGQKEE